MTTHAPTDHSPPRCFPPFLSSQKKSDQRLPTTPPPELLDTSPGNLKRPALVRDELTNGDQPRHPSAAAAPPELATKDQLPSSFSPRAATGDHPTSPTRSRPPSSCWPAPPFSLLPAPSPKPLKPTTIRLPTPPPPGALIPPPGNLKLPQDCRQDELTNGDQPRHPSAAAPPELATKDQLPSSFSPSSRPPKDHPTSPFNPPPVLLELLLAGRHPSASYPPPSPSPSS
ncbi:uncharacterized protein [Macrobrachium rosenbergii]|uniref:uncharacterized protein n=1 Tax=Macrobrachium rosenbergii TaxID=79674 RepID=UPI0034D61BAC